jgi:hypothetical protein
MNSRGRLTLPADWRESELGENKEVFVIKRKGYLKMVPKRKVDLTEWFDQADLGVESIGTGQPSKNGSTRQTANEVPKEATNTIFCYFCVQTILKG